MDNDHDRLQRPRSGSDAPLPPERAFVAQLRPLRDPRGEVLVGRVEHIASGAVGRFACAAELTAFIVRIGGSPTESLPADDDQVRARTAMRRGQS